MTWLQIIGGVASIVAILGVPWGLWMAAWELNYRKSTGHLGPLCTEEDKMGYFVVEVSRKWLLCPFLIPKTPPPHLPTVTALISAGDDDWFTSSIFNDISQNHVEVSWRPLYEAFFRECVWASDRRNSYGRFSRCVGLHKYRVKAEQDIEKRPETAHRRALGAPREMKSAEAVRHVPQSREDRPPRRNGSDVDIDVEASGGSNINAEDSPPATVEEPCRPVLVPSQRALPQLKGQTGNDWWEKCKDIWIHAGHPSIAVSMEELMALALIVGIPLRIRKPDFLPEGIGAYGIILTSDKIDGISSFSLVYGPGIRTRSWGSGYSTLFAKHMACGCLPFQQRRADGFTVSTTDTIPITDRIKVHVESGGSIDDSDPGEGPAASCISLYRLPSSTATNFFRRCIPKKDDQTQSLYSVNSADKKDQSENRPALSHWWEAVAGIAFGGLVPMATKNLKDIVRFTLSGSLEWSEFPGDFTSLEDLVKTVNDRLKYMGYPRVFDSRIDLRGPNVTYIKDPEDDGNRTNVETLDRYNTLLERLMAIASRSYDNKTKVVDEVYRELSGKLKDSYHNVVRTSPAKCHVTKENSTSNKSSDGKVNKVKVAKKTVRETLADIQANVAKVDAEKCAEAALCIIAAWTHLARTIDWEDKVARRDHKGDGEEAQEDPGVTMRTYYPPLWRDLPDVSIWK